MKRRSFLMLLVCILLCIVLLAMVVFSGCTPGEPGPSTAAPLPPIEETYEYSTKSGYYLWPSLVDNWVWKDALTTTTEDGTFFCLTADTVLADDFINAQRTLLRFLRDHGVEIGEMEYYATDYNDSFSESSKSAAYIALSSVRSHQQVLVTLQALWGDYTDYGYVYAMSNAIAGQLGWQTEPAPAIEKTSLDAFFSQNPAAINLLYPSFTTEFASEETVNSCKALSRKLFEEIDWRAALARPIEAQLDDYYGLVSGYAQEISVPFTRQTCGYAYYGQRIPLRILTSYAEFFVEDNYSDRVSHIYGDYFSDYESIYQTANTIDGEITASVEYFNLEAEAGVIPINWLSVDSADQKFGNGYTRNRIYFDHYNPSLQAIYATTLEMYLHEYFHHMEHLLNPDLGQCWQSQAFCEIGRSHSQYSYLVFETFFSQDEQGSELFYSFTGRTYQPGADDFYEANNILCVINGYELHYISGGPAMNSLNRYLLDLYGEETVYNILLFPETVEAATGKSWEDLTAEWKQHIQNKYADIEIPDWVSQ